MTTSSAVSVLRSLAGQTDGQLVASQLVHWLSEQHFGFEQKSRAAKFEEAMASNPKHAAQLAALLFQWICQTHLYPALVSLGIFSRRGFFREMASRIYEKMNPAPKDFADLKDVLVQLFKSSDHEDWLERGGADELVQVLLDLASYCPAEVMQNLQLHCREETLYALEMLGIWVAAEEIEPELMRMDKRLISIDSPFIALHREMTLFVEQGKRQLAETELPCYDLAHFDVMLRQCRDQVDRLRRRGAGLGSSVSVAHLLERLEQTLDRIELLVAVWREADPELWQQKLFVVLRTLVTAGIEKNSVSALWRSSSQMLSKSITVNKSGHGEHYIARTKSQFFHLVKSAAGAGVIIALMALLKICIESQGYSPFHNAALVSLNYGLGFVLIHMLGFTVATKQPAMTAASFASEVERGENGRAVHKKLAGLLIDVNRSQWAAVWGNVTIAVLTACAIAGLAWWWQGEPLLNAEQVRYQLNAVSPLAGSLFFAAIAGVWLFCSGLIAGFFENRANYLDLRVRLYQHPGLKQILPERARKRFAAYMHQHYGALAGNFFFGILLGMTGYIGYLSGLPLDIRHVAFASANLGYSTISGDLSVLSFVMHLLLVLLIGFVNLWVSFTLALAVALRARGSRLSRIPALLKSVLEQARQNPVQLFFPVPAVIKPAAETGKAAAETTKAAAEINKVASAAVKEPETAESGQVQ
ncbi:site-specific recombinase [Rheinheimera sp.]|uniref:site-specific recombinase n=1 Tax=Rheinheimera sp. TaxID=1869214 RepID=UPI003AF978B1